MNILTRDSLCVREKVNIVVRTFPLKRQRVEQLGSHKVCKHCNNLVQRSTKTLTLKAATPCAESLIIKLRHRSIR